MSLLMDALKRAETSKQEAARSLSGQEPRAADALSLEPVTPSNSRGQGSPLPELAAHIDAVDADLAANLSPPGTPRKTPPAAQTERESVRNAFAAKQAMATQPSRLPIYLTFGLLAAAGLGIGAYVWYQMQAMGKHSLAPSVPSPTIVAGNRPSPQPLPLPLLPPAAPSSSDAAEPSAAGNAMAPSPSPPPRPPRPAATLAAEPAPTGANIRFTRSRPELDGNLVRGYNNVQRNELDLARHDYEQVLQRDPNNTDALLALAAIAQRQGRPADAERLQQRALVANPSDPSAQAAALSGGAAGADPQTTESRLKSLLANQPESAPLNFALGNLYARQNRWAEAQQVYFNAVAAEGDNPDYLFNLAVSLDHIRQSRLAAQHYRLALEAADKRPAAFDRERIRRRLTELQP